MDNMMSDDRVARRLLAAWKIAKPGEMIPYEVAYVLLADECPVTPEELEVAKSLDPYADKFGNNGPGGYES